MRVDAVKVSRFMRQIDVGNEGKVFTVKGVEMQNVANEGEAPDEKAVCYFSEFEKPLVLNVTNFESIIKISGKEDSDDWAGTKVLVYNNPEIEFGGKTTGGIRVRKPKDTDVVATKSADAKW